LMTYLFVLIKIKISGKIFLNGGEFSGD